MDTYPSTGLNVNITLVNGVQLIGYWDGVQWWTGVNDMPEDVPLANEYVESWSPIS